MKNDRYKEGFEAGKRNGECASNQEEFYRGYHQGKTDGVCDALGVILIIALILFIGSAIVSWACSSETITIQSKIVDVKYDSGVSYYTIWFANGACYNIDKSSSTDYVVIDFDQSEDVIVELQYYSPWCFPNVNDCWSIHRIIKY